MKTLKKRVKPFLILAMLPTASGINLYSSEITTVTIRNNRVKINLEKAKKIVFEHSKVHSNNVKLTKLILEKENKKYVYAIEFYYKNKRYRYNVDANTGRVITHSSSENLVSDSRWGVGKAITFQAKNAPAVAPAPAPAPMEQKTEPDKYADMPSMMEYSKRITEEESYDRAKYNFSRKEKNVENIILEQLKKNIYDDLNNASFEEIILIDAEKSIYKGTIKANYIEYNFKINLSTGEILKWKLKK